MKKNTIVPGTIFLIDGSSFLYRAYYSLPRMYTKHGDPVQVVYGFCRMLKKLIDRFSPSHAAIIWDPPHTIPTVRHQLYHAYKQQRESSPSELNAQRALVKECASIIGFPQFEYPGIEADDILYSLACDFIRQNEHVVLITSDKDMRQCVGDYLLIFDPFKDAFLDKEAVESRYGVPLEKLVFYFALVGDPTDNIPGARGIGPKTAQELVNAFSSVEDLYEHADKIEKERTRNLVQVSHDNVVLSQKLFALHYYATNITKQNLSFDGAGWFKARDFFKRLEFASLLKDFPPEPENGIADSTGDQKNIFPDSRPEQDIRCVAITNRDDLATLCEDIRAKGACAIDTETDSLHPLRARLVGISVCTDVGVAYYIPLGHQMIPDQLDLESVRELLGAVFRDATIKKYLHNAKFDRLVLFSAGFTLAGIAFDTLLAAHLVTRDWQKINLKWLSEFYLHRPMHSFQDVIKKHHAPDFSYMPLGPATEYAALDAHQTYALVAILQKELEDNNLLDCFLTLEMPLLGILYDMEVEGIVVDPTVLADLDHHVDQEIQKVEREIQLLLPDSMKDVNLNSPRQLGELLFGRLQLPPIKKTTQRTGYSTDQEVLNELAKLHPVPALIVKYREFYKIKSTYIDALRAAINPVTGRIHTSFSQTATATGRLASSDPNLQNIPIGTSPFSAIRSAFKAPTQHVFLSADYSQIELRVLAHVSQDTRLVQAFKDGHDIHAETAAGLFDVPLADVKPEQRSLAKRINFSIIYGISPYGLSKDLGIPFKDAKNYIECYFEHYPQVVLWMDRVIDDAKRDGYVKTLWGRRRYIPGIYEKNRQLYELARRIAINTVVQGTASELMKKGMIELYGLLHDNYPASKMVLHIHDELLLTVPSDEQSAVQPLVAKTLENVVSWDVTLLVSLRIGDTWQDVTK